jgi:hypothetical protein
MNSSTQFEDRASRSRSKHEGESSSSLCDRHSRTRDLSQRQLPTDQDYAVSTREYQTDQSSLTPALAAAGPVLDQRQKQRQQQKQPHRCAEVDRVTPYQGSSAQVTDFVEPGSFGIFSAIYEQDFPRRRGMRLICRSWRPFSGLRTHYSPIVARCLRCR